MITKFITLALLSMVTINIVHFAKILIVCLPGFVSGLLIVPAVMFVGFVFLVIVNKMTIQEK